MMIDPKGYRENFEESALDELICERDRLIEFMRKYERRELPDEYYGRCPNAQTKYELYMEYMKEIFDLIKIRMQKDDFHLESCRINTYRDIDREMSSFNQTQQKEFMDKMKSDFKELYDGYIQWKRNEEMT